MSTPPRRLSFAVGSSLLTASLALGAGGCDERTSNPGPDPEAQQPKPKPEEPVVNPLPPPDPVARPNEGPEPDPEAVEPVYVNEGPEPDPEPRPDSPKVNTVPTTAQAPQ
ncbi:hypothetical protein [Enhygromyxa salina]|uniref:Uncharacterized protein n=1 Tax=Enhygromyxa salina TaxID=215803 RepID=A0A2S9YTN5_9BACT|nr:hypothetical protein [Enhygromyxa salina]PRQ08392.1 hypothetical protein ENSA7_20190 [Enhygromyxa salina]